MSGLIRLMFEKFDYYAQPEGKDPIGKIMGLQKYGLVTGVPIAIYDAGLYSKCANAPQFFNTLGYWMVPIIGMGLAFSTVTYTLVKVRGVDDRFNYIFGALSAGGILHAWQRNFLISGWGTFAFFLYAYYKKTRILHGNPSNMFIPATEPQKWLCPWRNVEYRNYSSKPRFEHVKDYY